VFADFRSSGFATPFSGREHSGISVHTHNDRGCGRSRGRTGASWRALDRVEDADWGTAKRTGNMDLVTMAMNLYSQGIDQTWILSGMA